MNRYCLAAAALLAFSPGSEARADLHLGMKLACKRYSEAWNTGRKAALHDVCTREFASIWDRVPDERFADLPRGGAQGRVLNSRKMNGRGQVTVLTPHGKMTLELVGQGFDWQVCDIIREGDDGRDVSMRQYLDASLTAGEFMEKLKNEGGSSFYDKVSSRFRYSFRRLRREDIDRVRGFLPEINKDITPYLTFQGARANMKVRIPDAGPNDFANFSLINERGWKVDDYSIDSDAVSIPSFRSALPVIASVSAFAEFVENPRANDPAEFTTDCLLREELEFARSLEPFPISPSGRREEFAIDRFGRSVQIRYPDRTVRMTLEEEDGRVAIAQIQTQAGDRWADVAHMLSVKRKLQSLSVASVFQGFRFPAAQQNETVEESTLSNVVALEPENSAPSKDIAAAAPRQPKSDSVAVTHEPMPIVSAPVVIHTPGYAMAPVFHEPAPVYLGPYPIGHSANAAVFVAPPAMPQHVETVVYQFHNKREFKQWRRQVRYYYRHQH